MVEPTTDGMMSEREHNISVDMCDFVSCENPDEQRERLNKLMAGAPEVFEAEDATAFIESTIAIAVGLKNPDTIWRRKPTE